MYYQYQPFSGCYFIFDDCGEFLQSCDAGELWECMKVEDEKGVNEDAERVYTVQAKSVRTAKNKDYG